MQVGSVPRMLFPALELFFSRMMLSRSGYLTRAGDLTEDIVACMNIFLDAVTRCRIRRKPTQRQHKLQSLSGFMWVCRYGFERNSNHSMREQYRHHNHSSMLCLLTLIPVNVSRFGSVGVEVDWHVGERGGSCGRVVLVN